MGYWGYRPNENDGAQDLLHENVWEPMNKSLLRLTKARRLDAYQKWERIGVVYEVAKMRFPSTSTPNRQPPIDHEVIERCIGWLDEVVEDDDWIDAWQDPSAARRSVKSVRDFLEKFEGE